MEIWSCKYVCRCPTIPKIQILHIYDASRTQERSTDTGFLEVFTISCLVKTPSLYDRPKVANTASIQLKHDRSQLPTRNSTQPSVVLLALFPMLNKTVKNVRSDFMERIAWQNVFVEITSGIEDINKVAFYAGGAGLLVVGIFIGMLLTGVKNNCCSRQQRVSEQKNDERQYPAKRSIEMNRYEYIDEEHMTHQHQGTVPPSLPVLRKFRQHQCKKASDNNYTDAMDGQNGNRIEDEGYLNPYQPIQEANIYQHEYKAIGAKITKNKQIDEYLHPYNSLLKHDMAEGHEYKDLRNANIKSELKNSGSNTFQSYV
ncbi:unnamed protein product [Mytilus coruscus]|uniref:Uncharacterized protein n=1 Tax=Mytilus coruscus TaxID=42192 RepID=A0A6J8ES63_MYTCO|nr:unnamed protein product [Mytilus coruscus]